MDEAATFDGWIGLSMMNWYEIVYNCFIPATGAEQATNRLSILISQGLGAIKCVNIDVHFSLTRGLFWCLNETASLAVGAGGFRNCGASVMFCLGSITECGKDVHFGLWRFCCRLQSRH
jgi:hypothetical protein